MNIEKICKTIFVIMCLVVLLTIGIEIRNAVKTPEVYTGYELENTGRFGYQMSGKTYTATLDALSELKDLGRVEAYKDGFDGIKVRLDDDRVIVYNHIDIEDI